MYLWIRNSKYITLKLLIFKKIVIAIDLNNIILFINLVLSIELHTEDEISNHSSRESNHSCNFTPTTYDILTFNYIFKKMFVFATKCKLKIELNKPAITL